MIIIKNGINTLPEQPSDEDTLSNEPDYIMGKDVVYTTGTVAEILNTTRDKLRYHIKDFEEYLNIEKTKSGKGGHIRLHSNDIELLRTILQLKDSGKSVEQIKQILDDPDLSRMSSDVKKMQAALQSVLIKNNEMFMSALLKILENHETSRDIQLIEAYESHEEELIKKNNELTEQVSALSNEITELKSSLSEFLERNEKKSFWSRLSKK